MTTALAPAERFCSRSAPAASPPATASRLSRAVGCASAVRRLTDWRRHDHGARSLRQGRIEGRTRSNPDLRTSRNGRTCRDEVSRRLPLDGVAPDAPVAALPKRVLQLQRGPRPRGRWLPLLLLYHRTELHHSCQRGAAHRPASTRQITRARGQGWESGTVCVRTHLRESARAVPLAGGRVIRHGIAVVEPIQTPAATDSWRPISRLPGRPPS